MSTFFLNLTANASYLKAGGETLNHFRKLAEVREIVKSLIVSEFTIILHSFTITQITVHFIWGLN